MDNEQASQTAIFMRSKRAIVLTGSETEEEAKQALSQVVIIPRPPKFNNVHEQRVHMKQRLAAGFRLLAKYGWDEGVAGHATFRDPEYPDLFWVNPFGMYFGHIKASDLVLVDHEGSIVRGNRFVNKAAFVIHGSIHTARSDVVCAVHTHSMYGKTFSTFGRPLLPISQDACAFYDDHSVYDQFGGLVFDSEEGKRLVNALGPKNKALILQNHGLVTTGSSIESAFWFFVAMERCCQSQLLAEAAAVNGYRDLCVIPDETARRTWDTVGTQKAGYGQFMPMFDMIAQEQPDCLL
ncbi:arad-like aldolase/epimerase [Hesseltinella vesiculosa]|uniref:Arad-like aldolase/epimerase n=1 Tax=Hesseltinella vesiculosa TaxID=101127 RepID=A0A1X2GRF0_9FUNG|nr:arad-like aldolase/epimerase [Hesseltinella vesiculosa]